DLPPALASVAIQGLKDADAFVRRCAAEALGRHPAFANIRPLLELRQAASADDTHLIHVVRMALRNQFLEPPAWGRLEELHLSERDASDIADVSTGVPSAEAAAYLLRRLDRTQEPQARVLQQVHHVARFGDPAAVDGLLAYVRNRGAKALDEQAK